MDSILNLINKSTLSNDDYNKIITLCNTLKQTRTKNYLIQKANNQISSIECDDEIITSFVIGFSCTKIDIDIDYNRNDEYTYGMYTMYFNHTNGKKYRIEYEQDYTYIKSNGDYAQSLMLILYIDDYDFYPKEMQYGLEWTKDQAHIFIHKVIPHLLRTFNKNHINLEDYDESIYDCTPGHDYIKRHK